MTHLNNKQRVIDELTWLTNSCTLPYFSASRIPSYELEEIKENFLNSKKQTAMDACRAIFSRIDIKEPQWDNNLRGSMLPALAFIPDAGICVVVEQEANGAWRSEDINGKRVDASFPVGTIFTPIKVERKVVEKTSAKGMFKKIAFQQKRVIVHAIIASLSINFLAIATSLFSMQVYDRVIPTQGISTLVALSIGVAIAILLEMILKVSRSHILDHATRNMDISYSHEIFKQFLKVRLDALPKSVGTMSGQLQSYSTVRSFISSLALYVFIDFPFSLIFLGAIVMIAGWTMGAIAVGFLFVAILAGMFFKGRIERLTKESSAASHKKLGLLVESVENAESIKASGAGWNILGRWNALSEDSIHDDIKIKHYSELSTFISGFLQQFSYIALVATGAYLVSTTDQLTMGGLIAATILSGRVLSPIAMLPNLLVQWGRTKTAVEDLDKVYSLDCDNEGVSTPLSPEVLNTNLACENISFSYGDNKPALRVSRLNIAQGERVAILGMIGSGKSTLLKVLSGLYKVQEGIVSIDGIDIQQISRNKLSEKIGYLSQNTKLISGTLRDNILLGLSLVTDAEIIEASKKTGLIHLINNNPQGLDTLIPEGGESVSGGQKQMISITRMILANPEAWLLDEPTASMDDRTEKLILDSIENTLSENSTLVLVTHKPALLRLVNRIIVMGPQGIVMDGPRDEVLEKISQKK